MNLILRKVLTLSDRFDTLSVIPEIGKTSKATNLLPELRSFKPFRRLPLELRLKVWRLTEPSNKFVKLTCRHAQNTYPVGPIVPRYLMGHSPPARSSLYSDAPLVISLQVCKESRTESLKRYQRLLISSQASEVKFRPQDQTLWINECEHPTHCCPRSNYGLALERLHPRTYETLQHIVFDIERQTPMPHFLDFNDLCPLMWFRSLRRITMVLLDAPVGREIIYYVSTLSGQFHHVVKGPNRMAQLVKELQKHFDRLFDQLKPLQRTWTRPEVDFKIMYPKSGVWQGAKGHWSLICTDGRTAAMGKKESKIYA